MHDVARLAGVSHMTVSRVLNNHPSVAESTRAKVQAAIDELGYRRNVAARTLVTRRSDTIGVITSGSSLYGPSTTLIAVERAAREAGYFVSVASLESIETSAVTGAIGHFVDQGVDGIVAIAPEAGPAHLAEPFRAQVPVVLVAAGAEPAAGVRIASVDQELGARLATRHLVELGHTRIGHVAGPDPWFDATARVRGWRRELKESRLRPGPVVAGDWTAEGGAAAARVMIRKGLPSALFVANDLMALGVIRALHDAGLSVPQDVSVVGFDDAPGSAYFVPGLTTVRQDLEALGAQCIEMLLDALGGAPADRPPIEPELVIRESTARL
ncbi:LacI family DNA-binding transcriptional regulator [Nakamurella sp. YIM 132087]|uniref:LacI family DNA-binding transcriptional regulator n=2 Tax=Nakamurella alba TaxID=2665158 RepID=A0A7K1FIT6_9ACTN|nr:LacI family DNA-binding transcriptional regulator [Nakamurella alba]